MSFPSCQRIGYRRRRVLALAAHILGTIQRRLAWPLRKDDSQIREAFHIKKRKKKRRRRARSLEGNHKELKYFMVGGRRVNWKQH